MVKLYAGQSSSVSEAAANSPQSASTRYYVAILRACLRRPKTVVAVVTLVAMSGLASVPYLGTELLPESDEGRIDVQVTMPPGTPLPATAAVMHELERRLAANLAPHELAHVVAAAGPDQWWQPQLSHVGKMQIVLSGEDVRSRSTQELVGVLNAAFQGIPDAKVWVKSSSTNLLINKLRGGDDRLVVELRGEDLDRAVELAEELRHRMHVVEGMTFPKINREAPQSERIVRVHEDVIAAMGLSPKAVSETLQQYVNGNIATRMHRDGVEIPIRVELAGVAEMDVEELARLPIVNAQGAAVALSTVAEVGSGWALASISRENRHRTVKLSSGTTGRDLGAVVAEVRAVVREVVIPEGIDVRVTGEHHEQRETFTALAWTGLLSLLMVYLVLVVQFEALGRPLMIMSAIPFAVSGAAMALFVTGTTLNMNSALGTIILVGIVINNAIVLVHHVDDLRSSEALPLHEAIVQGSASRLRPIAMTTLTTILGMGPLALELWAGSEMQVPLARVIIGGLLFSSLVTLVLIPCAYALLKPPIAGVKGTSQPLDGDVDALDGRARAAG